VRTARGGRTASVITTAALLGALAFPSAAGATEILEAPASEATPTAVAPVLEPTPTPIATSDPEPTSTPEPTSSPEATSTPEPAPAPTSTPEATTAPTAAPAAPAAATPVLTLTRTTYTAGLEPREGDLGWGDGINALLTGFAPDSIVTVSLMDGPTEEARTESIVSTSGVAAVTDWSPSTLTDGTSLNPHLPRPGEQITVVATVLDADGRRVSSNAAPLTILQPDPAVTFWVEETFGIPAGTEIGVAGFRVFGAVGVLSGFDRDETVTTTLTAPDGTVTTIVGEYSNPLYGEAAVPLTEDTMADQFGTFTVTGVGETSGRTVSASLVQVAGDPGIRIWPIQAPFEPAPGDGQPTSGGWVFGFAPSESVTVTIHSVDGTRQRLADGGTRLSYTVDAVGWTPIAIGEYPLADPEAEVYCVVAVGASSGRVASTAYDYGTTEADPIAEGADCSVAEAAARAGASTGAGSGSGGGVTAGRPVLAATGVSPAAPLALAAFGILSGLALMITRRRRA